MAERLKMLPGRKGEIYQYTDNDFKILLIPNTQWYQRTNETLLVSPIQKKNWVCGILSGSTATFHPETVKHRMEGGS